MGCNQSSGSIRIEETKDVSKEPKTDLNSNNQVGSEGMAENKDEEKTLERFRGNLMSQLQSIGDRKFDILYNKTTERM